MCEFKECLVCGGESLPHTPFCKRHLKSVTIEKMRFKYGAEEGERKFIEYKLKQSQKNKFEYKRDILGWSEEDFIEFNKSRATTLTNMIKKYGEEEGKRRFESYRELQRSAGTSLEYFINKNGGDVVAGNKEYLSVCKSKSVTLERQIAKYGEEEGLRRFTDYTNKLPKFVSQESLKFFNELISVI